MLKDRKSKALLLRPLKADMPERGRRSGMSMAQFGRAIVGDLIACPQSYTTNESLPEPFFEH